MSKLITRFFDGSFIKKTSLPFDQLYCVIKDQMPLGVRWVVDTGKRKRLYFWFYGNKHQGNQLCWSNLPV